MNSSLAYVRTDASPWPTSIAFADLIWPVAAKLGGESFKLMLGYFSKKKALKRYPFRPEAVILRLDDPPTLFDPPSLARLTVQLTVNNQAEWDFTSSLIELELRMRNQPLFTLPLPLSLQLARFAETSLFLQTYLTPGLVEIVGEAMGEAEEIPADLHIRLPAIHVLGQHLVKQHWATYFRVQARHS